MTLPSDVAANVERNKILASNIAVRRSRLNGGYVQHLNGCETIPVADLVFAFLPQMRRRCVLGDCRHLLSRFHHCLRQPLPSTFSRLAVETANACKTALIAVHVHVCFIRLRQNYVHVQRRKQNGGSEKTAFLPAPLTFRMVWHH